MIDYVVCTFGSIDLELSKEVKKNTKGKVDLTQGEQSFARQIKSFGENRRIKFYIASRKDFYHLFDALIKAGVPYSQIVKPTPLVKDISILGTNYSYREEFLTNPSKPIDKDIGRQNLLTLKQVLDAEGLTFFLAYGTLLGAVREGDFISHDSDIDIGVYDTDKEKFLGLLFTLKELGLELVRFDKELVSLMKGGEYIDVYFFKKKMLPKSGWYCGGLYMPSKYLDSLDQIAFHGHNFSCPGNHVNLLVFLYGENWKVPVRDCHAAPLFSLRGALVNLLPLRFKQYVKKLLNL